jgi:hypothetical protein
LLISGNNRLEYVLLGLELNFLENRSSGMILESQVENKSESMGNKKLKKIKAFTGNQNELREIKICSAVF